MKIKFTGIKRALIAFMIFAIGSCFGWLGFLIFGDMASFCKIYYVSQKEILELEKERVKDSAEESLFFGQTEKVMDLIKTSASKYKGLRSKIIYTTDGGVSGQGLHSISKEIHGWIIERLKADKDYKANKAISELETLTSLGEDLVIHKFKDLKSNYLQQQLKGER